MKKVRTLNGRTHPVRQRNTSAGKRGTIMKANANSGYKKVKKGLKKLKKYRP